MLRLLPLSALTLALAGVAATANAQRPRDRTPAGRAPAATPAPEAEPPVAAPTLADLSRIAAELQSNDSDKVREAIDLLSVIDRPEVIPPLAALLRAGQSDAITDRALEALGGLAHRDAISVLTEFTHHRRPAARRRAFRALAAIRQPAGRPILERGLSDSDRSVRAAVAVALGEIGARESLEVLFRAFDRGVIEAAVAIGKLGDARSVTRFTEQLGRANLSTMLSGYYEFLRRGDITAEVKTQIVTRLGEVSGPMVRRFLEEYLATFDARDRGALKRHVETTLRRIPPAATAPAAAGGAA